MPTFRCDCGHDISSGSFPNPGVFRLFSEEAVDQWGHQLKQDEFARAFVVAPSVLKCPVCERLHINWRRNGLKMTYRVESTHLEEKR